MRTVSRRTAALSNLVLLLVLALSLPAPAIGQESDTTKEVPPAAAAPQAPGGNEDRTAPVSIPDIDCSKPLPGKKATLGVDDEILVAYADGFLEIKISKYDNTSKEDNNLEYYWTWRANQSDRYDLWQPRDVANTTADLDGDSRDEVITAFCSDNRQKLEAVSIKNPEASGGIAYDLWSSSNNYRRLQHGLHNGRRCWRPGRNT